MKGIDQTQVSRLPLGFNFLLRKVGRGYIFNYRAGRFEMPPVYIGEDGEARRRESNGSRTTGPDRSGDN